MANCLKCGKEFKVGDMVWECSRVEIDSIDKEEDTYEIGNVDMSEQLCDNCYEIKL